jgi:hypothetical protein
MQGFSCTIHIHFSQQWIVGLHVLFLSWSLHATWRLVMYKASMHPACNVQPSYTQSSLTNPETTQSWIRKQNTRAGNNKSQLSYALWQATFEAFWRKIEAAVSITVATSVVVLKAKRNSRVYVRTPQQLTLSLMRSTLSREAISGNLQFIQQQAWNSTFVRQCAISNVTWNARTYLICRYKQPTAHLI